MMTFLVRWATTTPVGQFFLYRIFFLPTIAVFAQKEWVGKDTDVLISLALTSAHGVLGFAHMLWITVSSLMSITDVKERISENKAAEKENEKEKEKKGGKEPLLVKAATAAATDDSPAESEEDEEPQQLERSPPPPQRAVKGRDDVAGRRLNAVEERLDAMDATLREILAAVERK